MACNSNYNNFKGLSQILDLHVEYTGCETECNGKTIKPGDNIRTVLDVLLSNCGMAPIGETTNFWFGLVAPVATDVANVDDYYLTSTGEIFQYVITAPATTPAWVDTGIALGGETEPTQWGTIEGDINLQTDLLAFIQDNAITSAKIGTGLSFDETEDKINLGFPFDAGGAIFRIIRLPFTDFGFGIAKDDASGDIDLNGIFLSNTASGTTLGQSGLIEINIDPSNASITINSQLPNGKVVVQDVEFNQSEIVLGTRYIQFNGFGTSESNAAILESPSGIRHKLLVANDGTLSTTPVV